MKTKSALALAGIVLISSAAFAADEERKIDPTFLHRNTATAKEAQSDITAPGCHFKPLFGDAVPGSGVARFAIVTLDAGASCKSVRYPSEDQIIVVLNGSGSASYGGDQVSLAKEDFLFLPATVPHGLRNTSTAALTVALMGYRTAGFPPAVLPPKPLKDNISNVPLEL